MAGQLKRDSPHLEEDIVLIRALRDSNLPKFLADDAILFRVCMHVHAYAVLLSTYIPPPLPNTLVLCIQGILSDLFPGVVLPEHDYGRLQLEIEKAIVAKELQVRTYIRTYVCIMYVLIVYICMYVQYMYCIHLYVYMVHYKEYVPYHL